MRETGANQRACVLALGLAAVPPLALTVWIIASVSGLHLGLLPTLTCFPAAMIAISLSRRPVKEYLAKSVHRGDQTPEGLVQFTPGYIRFYAGRCGWPAWPFIVGVMGPLVLIGIGWLALLVGGAL